MIFRVDSLLKRGGVSQVHVTKVNIINNPPSLSDEDKDGHRRGRRRKRELDGWIALKKFNYYEQLL